jgi:uncharacterized protein (UPF0264 family)
MRLLVSVADGADALAAIEGGAHVIDAKDPARGALGAVSEARLHDIVSAVGGARPVSVALGDIELDGLSAIERLAAVAAASGVAYVKVGFGSGVGMATAEASARRVVAAVSGACDVVLAAYADAGRARLDPYSVLDLAIAIERDRTAETRLDPHTSPVGAAFRPPSVPRRAVGVLLDTLNKEGVGLFDVLPTEAVAAWIARAHAANLLVAVAGSLRASDMGVASLCGADLVGVRGAVCEGGRGGRVSASRVRELVAAVRSSEWREALAT